MRFGVVILPQYPWPEARRRWQKAEQLGFHHAWTYDHLSWRSLADQPWGATVPLLTGAALATERIRLGTFVTSPNYRHPVPFAKDIASVDAMSAGRVILGIGSGGTGFDSFTLGQDELAPRRRHERYAEFVAGLDALLRFEPEEDPAGVSFEGEWFTAVDARMVGAPAQLPRMPFALAANGPKGLSLVAEYGQGWITTGRDGAAGEEWWRTVETLAGRLDGALGAAERSPSSVDRYLSIDSGGTYSMADAAYADDAVARAAELGFTDVIVHWPRDGEPYGADESAIDEFAARHLG
ncbi:LLM class flavin-dependent oxidoreductase [Tsukamurella sp. 8F]|uniref:LLM class flavin-dependent oxidoreductase n=1 Tax=unclassified Tsukamurella TaxID=2633480 RepID=UPI0023B923C0|nr:MULTISPECIES: LLM class flavin-dependent oxidoreductase [unclassified Tsukamurella]MDF0529443.1 LLM class flavin-dependent oxidoreductase [Tsukamurella sp. 8J]MDF0589352.1 LLM class flavin-dependent oxidoreductase [Tsukamurella sp. 8F]